MVRTVLIGSGGLAAVSLVLLVGLPIAYHDRALPGVTIRGLAVGGMKAEGVRAALYAAWPADARLIRFVEGEPSAALGVFGVSGGTPTTGGQTAPAVYAPTLAEVGVSLDVARTAAAALAVGREPGFRAFARRLALLRGVAVAPRWEVDAARLSAYLERAFPHLLRAPREPAWDLASDGSFVFLPGEPGSTIAVADVLAGVRERLAWPRTDPVVVRAVARPPAQPDADARVAGVAAERVARDPLTLVAGEAEIVIPPEVRKSWVREETATDGTSAVTLDREKIQAYLEGEVSRRVARPPRDAVFTVVANRATTFTPAAPGARLRIEPSVEGLAQGLAAGATRIQLVTQELPPAVAVTPLMEQYGVRALLARGESDFAGSPKNRIHNIRVGAARYDGLLVSPGTEFSFNVHLGEVDAANGYLPELVILQNVTTPQYGGGLCQVSTTLFRAAVHAGVPITARRNHAYAVSYYGTPGFDATIYPPNPDLRFVNDTGGHLLVRTSLAGTKLSFEFWGTPDGREVEILGPFPYDRQPDGAVKARLVRKVRQDGAERRDEWRSNYKSPKLFPKVLAANAETETWEERARRIAEKDRRAAEAFALKRADLQKREQQKGSSKLPPKTAPTPPSNPAAEVE